MAYLIVDVPKPGDIRTNQVSTILASDGSELAKIVPPEGNRVDVNIDQIPVHVRNAVMAAEDRDFYSNPGFSFTGFARAVKNNIFGGDLQGGSTITQQYVKNALVGDARSGIGGVVRKAKELVISTKMSSEWSKDQVLQSYLNIIYFGRGAYGISAASKAYFDKPVEQLTVAEGALLAALIQRPSALDPAVNPEGAAKRWNWVLDGMVDIGALSPTDRAAQVVPADGAAGAGAHAEPDHRPERADRAAGHQGTARPVQHQRADAEHRGPADHHDDRPEGAAGRRGGGHRRRSTARTPTCAPRSCRSTRKPAAVKAYYGGTRRQRASTSRRPGCRRVRRSRCSRWWPRCEQGMGLGYQVDSSPVTVNGIKITNVEGEGCGTCNIAEALKRSLNTSLLPADAEAEERAGRTSPTPRTRPASPRASPAWTTRCPRTARAGRPTTESCWASTRLACSTWRRRTPRSRRRACTTSRTSCRRWSTREGEVLFDAGQQDNSGEQRIDKAVADNVTSAMQPIAG